jgi:hypothetical protein
MYINLFHGRKNLQEDPEERGFDGPTFGPLESIQVTYGWIIQLGIPDEDFPQLRLADGCVYYDENYYGDFSISLEPEGKTVKFETEKANSNVGVDT